MIASPTSWFTRITAGATLLLAVYWAVFVLVTPVTVYDSHTYNLARLMLAEHGGMFADGIWNSQRQIIFPWSFDAIHYPFLKLVRGFGIALPSFMCFVGTLVIVWRTVRSRYSTEVSWLVCLALFALPTLIFQATSTKNDIPLVFGTACWLYAFLQWRRTGLRVHLVWAAVALGFIAGAKTSGIPVAIILSIFTTIYLFLKNRSILLFFVGAMTAAVLLLGSIETYANNFRVYSAPLGDVAFVQNHQNRDGIRGTAANIIRYTIGNINVGYNFDSPKRSVPIILERASRDILTFLNLRDVGYRSDFKDEDMRFLKIGMEAATDFGPLGALALLGSLIILLVVPPRDPSWLLAACGWTELVIISATTAWMPWNARFLLIPFVCFVIALILALKRSPNPWRFVRWGVLALSVFSATFYPLTSFNKKPTDLLRAVKAREDVMLAENYPMHEIFQDLRARSDNLRATGVALVAGDDSWILPFYLQRNFPVFPLPKPTSALLTELADRNGGSMHVFALSRPDIAASQLQLTLLHRYPETNSALYFFNSPSPGTRTITEEQAKRYSSFKETAPKIVWLKGHYSDGWTADNFEFTINNEKELTLTVALSNPTPLSRKFQIKSSIDIIQGEILAGSKISLSLKISTRDTIRGNISPAFIPRQHGAGPDDRTLGLNLQLQFF